MFRGSFTNKWIVVTTINYPTEDIKRLAKIPGWSLVVVGDTKTPSNWSLEGVHFLSLHDQRRLGYSIEKDMPYKSYTRKNIGYLYAIENGAQWIYDTDDDNKPYGILLSLLREGRANHTNDRDQFCLCHKMRTAAVQQGLVHNDPDVDAVFRYAQATNADKRSGLNEEFSRMAPPIVLEAEVTGKS
ncbi:hypothetical protein COOONC_14045 [Cooperia oncophora]